MHGLSVADALIQNVLKEVDRRGGVFPKDVRVKVGRDMFSTLDELTGAWKLLTQDTPLKNAKLTVEVVRGRDCVLSDLVF